MESGVATDMTRKHKRKANPQGKGLVPVLQGLEQLVPRVRLQPKQIDQIEMELFTSLFVLQSELKFAPVPDQSYWMYHTDSGYRLLMVGPDEWHRPYPGRCIGECILQQDRTWTLLLQAELALDKAFLDQIAALHSKLQQRLTRSARVEEVLPAFEASLGYHGRVLAFLLGKSLLASMQLAGIHSLDYQGAQDFGSKALGSDQASRV
jgi:hypothetical protein